MPSTSHLLVLLTVLLITLVPFFSTYYIFFPWLIFTSEWYFIKLAGPFFALCLGMWYSYLMTCITEPGYITSTTTSGNKIATDSEDFTRSEDEEELLKQNPLSEDENPDTMQHFRWCKKCEVYKTFRSHHCKICKRCVLKMDHHCPWTNNCVGHRNLPHFMRFLFYTTCAVWYCFFLISYRIYSLVHYQSPYHVDWHSTDPDTIYDFVTPNPTTEEMVTMIVCLIILLLLLITVGVLAGYQLYYLLTNMTTIEHYEYQKITSWIRRKRLDAEVVGEYPYDLGWYRNVCSVMGDRWWLWWLPRGAFGDGITFAKKSGTKDWPGEWYYEAREKERRGWVDDYQTTRNTRTHYEDTTLDGQDATQQHTTNKTFFNQQYNYNGNRNHARRGSEGYIVPQINWDARLSNSQTKEDTDEDDLTPLSLLYNTDVRKRDESDEQKRN